MGNIEDTLLKAIDTRIKVLTSHMEFDKTYTGKVVAIRDNICIVNINGIDYNAKIKKGFSFKVGDVVVAKAPNNNFSYLFVDGVYGGYDAFGDSEMTSTIQQMQGDIELLKQEIIRLSNLITP